MPFFGARTTKKMGKEKKEKKNKTKDSKRTKKRDKLKKKFKKLVKSDRGAQLMMDEGFETAKQECIDAVQEIIDEGVPYIDEEFNMLEDTLNCIYGPNPQHDFSMNAFSEDNYEVKRLTEILGDDIVLFSDGATFDDIVQGGNGTCWYLGALMCVALHNKFLKNLAVNYSIELGVYGVMFYVNGAWTYVIIDDYFPINEEGEFYNSASKTKNEIWVQVFEKAFSKLRGSYDMVDGGIASEGIIDLTGGVVFSPQDDSFDYLFSLYKTGCYCFACGLNQDGTDSEEFENGLIPGHVYSVISLAREEGYELIKIRNPHGGGEWNGDFSDKSSLWTPSLIKKLKLIDSDDGSFWMPFDQFSELFSLDCCRLFPSGWTCTDIAEGTRYPFDEDEDDPIEHSYYEGYFILDLHKKGEVVINLSQDDPTKDPDFDIKRSDLVALGYTVVQLGKDGDLFNGETILDTEYLEEALHHTAELGNLSAGSYAIIPRFSDCEYQYTMRIISNSSDYELYFYHDEYDEEYEEGDEDEEEEEYDEEEEEYDE